MHVQIDHQQAAHQPLRQQGAGRHGHVIEDAETTPRLREGVVRATGQVTGQAMAQRETGGQQGAPHRQPTATHHARRGGQANATRLGAGEALAGKGLVVAPGVHQLQPPPWHGQGLVHLTGVEELQPPEVVNQQAELVHRKAMVLRQGGGVGRVMHQRNSHRPSRSISLTRLDRPTAPP